MKWIKPLALGLVLTAGTAAWAQSSAAPVPIAEKQDPITANKNLVVEDKATDPADHDFMPSAATVPQANMKMDATHGANLNQTSPDDTLITTTPDSLTPSTTKGPFYHVSENELRSRKFFRGLGNVFLAVGEVPNQMFLESYRTSPVTGMVVGAGKGLWMGAKRIMVGSWEIVTFFHPGKNHYQPYIQPEVVFQDYLH
jgi:putative exosortase-associated protein (TIGR04073 family)